MSPSAPWGRVGAVSQTSMWSSLCHIKPVLSMYSPTRKCEPITTIISSDWHDFRTLRHAVVREPIDRRGISRQLISAIKAFTSAPLRLRKGTTRYSRAISERASSIFWCSFRLTKPVMTVAFRPVKTSRNDSTNAFTPAVLWATSRRTVGCPRRRMI